MLDRPYSTRREVLRLRHWFGVGGAYHRLAFPVARTAALRAEVEEYLQTTSPMSLIPLDISSGELVPGGAS